MGIVAPINRLRGHKGVTVNLPTGLDVRHRHPFVPEAQISPEEAPDLAHGGRTHPGGEVGVSLNHRVLPVPEPFGHVL